MTFTVETYVFAFLMLVFAGFFLVVSYREKKFSKFITGLIGVTFFSLAIFGVLVGLASSVNFSNTAPCENVVNSSLVVGNTTTYSYTDSCSGIPVPKSISMLYVAYNYLLLFIIFVAVFSLMFIGLTKVILKW